MTPESAQLSPELETALNEEMTKQHAERCATESLTARYRRTIRARAHFPTEQPAMKCLYLVTRSLDPTGTADQPKQLFAENHQDG